MASIRELGGTRDDAAGEAFDKFGKLVGLGYPGGPRVDRLAMTGDASRAAARVPAPMRNKDSLEFSFSGLKTAIARSVERDGVPEGPALADLCAAFQTTVVRTLAEKTLRAARAEGLTRVVIGGGVAANRGLRDELARRCDKLGYQLFVPPFASCTDNAAMIAYVGALRLVRGERDAYDLSPSSKTELLRITRKGGGKRARPS